MILLKFNTVSPKTPQVPLNVHPRRVTTSSIEVNTHTRCFAKNPLLTRQQTRGEKKDNQLSGENALDQSLLPLVI